MNVSLKWLNEYVDITGISPREFSEAMTMSGSKVEGYENQSDNYKKVVVGKVVKIERHPDADKLVVCQVDIAKGEPIQIVTGATNLYEGAVIPVALHKSLLPGGKKITKGKLRGVLSNGMMCSLSELELDKADFPDSIEDGILVLNDNLPLGQPIEEALDLNDVVVEFEITSNRPDCMSVRGIAREAHATFDRELKLKDPIIKKETENIDDYLKVFVEAPELCSRFTAKMVKNVKIGKSPKWMRERLKSAGVRPINNIVDITNYIMLEYGQPMHAYDYNFLRGGEIHVHTAQDGEKFITLDEQERILDSSMLVIADKEGAIGLAGVMGGFNSEIKDDTTTVVFEAATFKGSNVRVTAKKVGMRTDASSRFEKGLDSHTPLQAVTRACELVELLGCGEVVGGTADCYPTIKEKRILPLDVARINALLGTDISRENMNRYLEALDFEIQGENVVVPTNRDDVEGTADLAEEVARIYGYNNIATTQVKVPSEAKLTPEQKFERLLHTTLTASGLNEIITYSFYSPKEFDKLNLPENHPLRNAVKISNPLGENTSLMRTTAIPSMLNSLAYNYNNRNMEAALYEVATEYIPTEEPLPDENKKLIVGMYGPEIDFFDLKGVLETLLESCGVQNPLVIKDPKIALYHPGRSARIQLRDDFAGSLGQVHPNVLSNFEIEMPVYLLELDFKILYKHAKLNKNYTPLPKFPASERDLALICNKETPVADIEETIKTSAGSQLESLSLFDVYEGGQIKEGKKSVAYNLVFRSNKETLTDEVVDKAVKKVLEALEKLNISLRD